MKVQDVMTEEVVFCSVHDNLNRAAKIMQQTDCGVVPIVDDEKRVVGIITDRDICLAVSSLNQLPSNIKVHGFTERKIVGCKLSEDVKNVLKKMRKNQIKRLPVTSQNGEILGIISVTDILFAAEKNKKLRKKILSTLIEISKPRPITLLEV